MKPLLLIMLLTAGSMSCKKQQSDAPPAVRHLNIQANPDKIRAMVKSIREKYKMTTRTQKFMRGGPRYNKEGIKQKTFWFFKTKKPVSGSGNQKYFYRFSFTWSQFKNLRSAERAFKKRLDRYRKEGEMNGKGEVSFTVIAGPSIYNLSTDCLMNRILRKKFALFITNILGGTPPEKNSLIEHYCGGSHAVK